MFCSQWPSLAVFSAASDLPCSAVMRNIRVVEDELVMFILLVIVVKTIFLSQYLCSSVLQFLKRVCAYASSRALFDGVV